MLSEVGGTEQARSGTGRKVMAAGLISGADPEAGEEQPGSGQLRGRWGKRVEIRMTQDFQLRTQAGWQSIN